MSLENLLLNQALEQLKSTTRANLDSGWLDSLIEQLTLNISNISDSNIKSGTAFALQAVLDNKGKLIGLGKDAFILLIQQLASGRQDEAINTYIQATGSIDDLIAEIDAGTWGLIQAKKRLDQWHKDAVNVVTSIAIKGAQYLLPLLLTLI